jgi:hypothetical protein
MAILNWLRNLLRRQVYTVREINRRYAKPRLKTTPMVKIALLMLRIYLLLLVVILLYKFFTLIMG